MVVAVGKVSELRQRGPSSSPRRGEPSTPAGSTLAASDSAVQNRTGPSELSRRVHMQDSNATTAASSIDVWPMSLLFAGDDYTQPDCQHRSVLDEYSRASVSTAHQLDWAGQLCRCSSFLAVAAVTASKRSRTVQRISHGRTDPPMGDDRSFPRGSCAAASARAFRCCCRAITASNHRSIIIHHHHHLNPAILAIPAAACRHGRTSFVTAPQLLSSYRSTAVQSRPCLLQNDRLFAAESACELVQCSAKCLPICSHHDDYYLNHQDHNPQATACKHSPTTMQRACKTSTRGSRVLFYAAHSGASLPRPR